MGKIAKLSGAPNYILVGDFKSGSICILLYLLSLRQEKMPFCKGLYFIEERSMNSLYQRSFHQGLTRDERLISGQNENVKLILQCI